MREGCVKLSTTRVIMTRLCGQPERVKVLDDSFSQEWKKPRRGSGKNWGSDALSLIHCTESNALCLEDPPLTVGAGCSSQRHGAKQRVWAMPP